MAPALGVVLSPSPAAESSAAALVVRRVAVALAALALRVVVPALAAVPDLAPVARVVRFLSSAPSSPSLPSALAVLPLALSNSKPILPLGSRTRKALNLRRVRDETKPVSRSVRPSASSFCIWAGSMGCCRISRPERKSQVLLGPTEWLQT